ncbi:double-stranded RNA-binding protein 2-like isoform X2 [Punica granatum]|uniref:Double-stranded RNA-binding protein 2-like isoform X2 n=1 Tax=Punica granatum TaxID=22663 RepID=A0A6P8E210_PUNGR|nr:double-stranded RNA-binding protein 2-like isoform X2 [Punica granatum]
MDNLSKAESKGLLFLRDETGVYKNLLQEIAQRVGAPLPQYTTYRSGLGHLPVFTGTVELAGIVFTGEPAKNKKQAEKNAAMAAWSSLKQLAKESASSLAEPENTDELEQITIARALINYRSKEKVSLANSPTGSIPFTMKFPSQSPRPTSPQPLPAATSKILPLICPRSSHRNRFSVSSSSNENPVPPPQSTSLDSRGARLNKFPAAGAAPYVPIRTFRTSCHGIAPPVTIRTARPVFSAPPRPPPQRLSSPMAQAAMAPPVGIAPPVCIRQAVPVSAAPLAQTEDAPLPPFPSPSPVQKEPQVTTAISPAEKESPTEAAISLAPSFESVPLMKEEIRDTAGKNLQAPEIAEVAVQDMKELKI